MNDYYETADSMKTRIICVLKTIMYIPTPIIVPSR